MRIVWNRIATLRPFVIQRGLNLSEEASLADVIFLAVGAGAFVAFAVLAAALKRV